MVVRRRTKKARKFRGKREQGYGSHKRHRGKGSRGGRGAAGMHKHKWSYTVKYEPDHFGKHGFILPKSVSKEVKAINVNELEKMAEGKKKIDLTKIGYNKVLGDGKINAPLEIIAESFSKKAVKKIEAAGGKAVVAQVEKIETKIKTGESETAESAARPMLEPKKRYKKKEPTEKTKAGR